MGRSVRRGVPTWAGVSVAVAIAVPALTGCGASRGAHPCSALNKRALAASVASLETRAKVTSLRASAPTCSVDGAQSLVAQRTYTFGPGVQKALEAALASDGWTTTDTPAGTTSDPVEGVACLARISSGRFVDHVQIRVGSEESRRSVIIADFDSTAAS